MDKEKIKKLLFWLILLFVILLQYIFTINSTNQIRYEELAESIRNVYWLQNKTVYDGVSSNIGWYGILMVIYDLFGFSLNTAKIFRFLLQLVSIFCLAFIFKKYLKEKAWLPLLTVGTSPTFIYLNTLQTSYGIDLQFLPICFLLATFEFKNKILNLLKPILFGFFSMVASMSYPTFIFYLPFLWGNYLFNLKNIKNRKAIITKLFLSCFFFLFPLITGFLYVKNVQLLIFDLHEKSGIFRGAGSFALSLDVFIKNSTRLLVDLFQKGSSYYFELPQPDFSGYYPIITVVFIYIFSILILVKSNKYRLFLISVFSILLLNLFFSNFNIDPSGLPGIRRNTGIFASAYILYTFSWYYLSKQKYKLIIFNYLIFTVFLLLPFHNLISYPANLESLKQPSLFRELWFGLTDLPNNYLNSALITLQKENLPLACQDKNGEKVFCRYSEIYGALAGACYWNKLNCNQILGYDPKTKKFIPLSISLWENYYWSH